MERRYSALMLLVLVTALELSTAAAGAFRCERRPKDVSGDPQPANGRYRLEFSGKGNTYVPDHTYRVKLFGARHGPTSKNMFRVFNLYLEPKWDESGSQHVGNLTLSSDSLITFGECANSVRQTSGRLKDSVEVLWRAPPAGSSCVIFRATVVEDTSKWYMDDEFLSLTICEEERMVYNRQPEVQDPCCACDEAKYELTFEGLWSRHSHPKDFPKSWDTRFSDVIGASHAANYSFWKYLQAASPGLRQVAENGTTRTLEKELKDNSQHIRTIIKARGIGWPNVTGKTFAVFRVDRDHHLMSIVSHIDPSPDWFVGISGLELCLKNCSWIENVKFDLYPWDAGTNDGITYYSKGQETRNELIRQITSSFPNSKDSPFFDPTGAEMKPIARIYLTRQRLYEKFSCDSHDNKNIDCATTPFTTLGPCSVTCGRGVRLQQREYLDPKKANDAFCNETLTRRFICDKSPCPPPWSNEGLLDPKCETTEWTEWSPCPVCGGVQARDRKYKHEEYFKYCSSLNHHPVLQETLHCDPDPYVKGCSEAPPEDIPKHCEVTHWSDWSPCSVTCGNGTRIRSRLLVARDFHTRQIEIMNKRHDDGMDLMDEENSNDEIEMLAAASDHADCSKYKISQEMQCTNIHEDCNISPEDAREICQLPKDEGPCRFQSEHWYFDVEVGRCKQFNYGGCRGNRNNFASQEICEEVCSSVIEDTDTTNNGFRSIPSFSLTQVSTDDVSEETTTQPERDRSNNERPINCRVSRWGPWTACSVTCGEGYKHKHRKIEVHPTKNGKPCPKLRKKHKCQKPQCDVPGVDCVLSAWSPWSSCTKSCGSDRRRLRTRDILVHPTSGGMPCDRRIEYIYCAPIPCASIETEVKTSGSETSECTVSRGSSAGGRALQSHRAATLFEPDNNSFFSSNNFTKVSASTAGSAGSDWPLSSLTLTHMPDVLPPVHSSEDWQAAFGFSNSGAAVPANEADSLNRQVVSETPSSSSEYSGGKDGDNCDPVSFDSQNGQQISVQSFNCHSSHSSSSENVSSNAVQNSEEYRLSEVGHLNHKLNELMLEESVSNGVVSDDTAGPSAGCEMSAEEMTLHSTANCENPNVVPCSQSHLYPNMPSPAFVQDPAVFMVNRHPFIQSGNHVIPNGIQPAQAAKFLSEIHLRQQSQVQNSQTPLPVHLRNHPVLEGTTYSRHVIEGGVNSKFVLNTNNFGGAGDGTNLLTYSKTGRDVQKLPATTSSESEENSGVSDNEKYSNYDTLERQTSCENSSDEFVEYNGDSENSAQENNEEMSPKENQRATDDDLGFDPFHETQKALAEMMEKENMMLMLQGQQNHVSHPNSHISHLNQLHQQYHQLNHMNHHPAQFTQATMFGGTKILPSCHAPLQPHLLQNNHRLQTNVAAANACSKMDGLALGPGPGPGSVPPRARLPPPGFTTAPNHMNAFGLGIPRAPTNTGSKILPFMGLGNGTSSTTTGTSSPIPQNLNSISANISISSALNAQQNVNNVNPTPLLFPHSNNHTSTASQLNSTFSAQNGAVAHSSAVPKSASDSFNAKEWPDNLRSLLPNINTGSGVSQSPVPVAFSGSNTPTPPSPPPPPPPSSQNSSYAVPAHTPAQSNPVKTWTGAGPCSDWTALDPAIMSSRPHSIFSSSSVTPQHPIILCNTNSVLNQQSPNTQYLHLQNTTHWLRSLASDGCLLYGANISQNMSNSDWTVQSHHSNSIAPPPPGFSLRMTTQQTAIQNKLAVSASQEITKIENI